MKIERKIVCNQFLVSSDLVSLYAVTKVLRQIWGPPFCPVPRPGIRGPFFRLCLDQFFHLVEVRSKFAVVQPKV